MKLTKGTWNIQWKEGKADPNGDLSKASVEYTPAGMSSPLKAATKQEACDCLTSGGQKPMSLHFIGDSHTRHFFGGMVDLLNGETNGLMDKDVGLPAEMKELCGGNNRYLNEKQCFMKEKVERTACDGKVKLTLTNMWMPWQFATHELDNLMVKWDKEANETNGRMGIIAGAGQWFFRVSDSEFRKVSARVMDVADKAKPAFVIWHNMFSQMCHVDSPHYSAQEPRLIKGNQDFLDVMKKHPQDILIDSFEMVKDKDTSEQKCELRTADKSHAQWPVQSMKSTIALHAICPNL
jgi:hypothetical protein